MKKFKHVLGVTLLEIMLVLAIASLIIVMSVRYYQSATASQQATQVLSQIQAILASADALSQGTGTYANVSTATIEPLLSNVGGLGTPWGQQMGIGATATNFTVTIPKTPAAVCGLIQGRLQGDVHYSGVTTCQGKLAQDFKYTYTQNP